MKTVTNRTAPVKMPMPFTLLQTASQTFIQLTNGAVQVITHGERPQIISRAKYDSIAKLFN